MTTCPNCGRDDTVEITDHEWNEGVPVMNADLTNIGLSYLLFERIPDDGGWYTIVCSARREGDIIYFDDVKVGRQIE